MKELVFKIDGNEDSGISRRSILLEQSQPCRHGLTNDNGNVDDDEQL
jgi:hypothetical protein